jgi:hypothetical protein
MEGGAKTNYLEAETYREMLKREDPWKSAAGRGYQDGLREKPLSRGKGSATAANDRGASLSEES